MNKHNNNGILAICWSMKPIALLLALVFSQLAFSQASKFDKSKEIGLVGGTAYYIGEVNPYRHFGTRLHVAGGLTFRNNFNKRWTLRLGAYYGNVEAWDSDSKDPWIRNRNLNFRNQFFEGHMIIELNFFDYQIGSDDWFSPYLFTGFAYYSMFPQGSLNGQWQMLQPAGTEGQGTSLGGELYRPNGLSMPAGAGVKMNLFAGFGLSLEWGVRKTWTDYFDDISGSYVDPNLLEDEKGTITSRLSDQSLEPELANGTNTGLQRGDTGRKDLYFFAMMSLNIRIDKGATTCWDGKVPCY